MMPYFSMEFGNPHSMDHEYGWTSHNAVQVARARVAQLIGADDEEVIFTSGATESCNLAIRGVAKAHKGNRRRVITLVTEHPAVLQTVESLADEGFEPAILNVRKNGLIDLDCFEKNLSKQVLLVSIMAVNNEIGVVQPLSQIGALCKRHGVIFHTDATQAAGRMRVNTDAWCVDLLSMSAHKMYGPKGVGVLFVRAGTQVDPISTGGGQERTLRPGTVPTPLVVGLGEACVLADAELDIDASNMRRLSARLVNALLDMCPALLIFGDREKRVPGNLSFGFPDLRAEEVIGRAASKIAISTGSACSSGTSDPSHVLLGLGLERDAAASGIRISLGRYTTERDVDVAIETMASIYSDSLGSDCAI